MNNVSKVRPSPIAGLWYSDNPEHLSQSVDQYLHPPSWVDLPGDVIALIAPHAGHRYSGQTAGRAFRALLGRHYDLAVVVSPLHHSYPGSLLTSAHQAYATPLGSIEIDQEALAGLNAALQQQKISGLTPIANDDEHSLEIELPFLQRALVGGFRLLPIMLRTQSPGAAESLGHALSSVLRSRSAILIASSDLSHFYPENVAEQLDAAMLGQIAAFSPQGVFDAEQTGKGYACGVAAIAAVLWAARDLGANAVEILHHSTSASETGDPSSVVGYGAAAVLKRA